MIATDFRLVPVADLCRHETRVRGLLHTLPFTFPENVLFDPDTRVPFLYYLLLTYWPEFVELSPSDNAEKNGHLSSEDVLFNRLYWYYRFIKRYQVSHDLEPALARRLGEVVEAALGELGADVTREIENSVAVALATNEQEIAVAFSDFSIRSVKRTFGLSLDESGNFFANVAPAPVSPLLLDTLKGSIPLALKIGTEKARSEMIIAPVLLEIHRRLQHKISLFSGVDWEVDTAQGLRGVCDFLMGLSSEQMVIEAPVLAVVEAKKEDLTAGIGQCLAEMIAARLFNQQNQTELPVIYGVVTTGSVWKFLRLIGPTAYIDVSEYHINEVERIVGILLSMFN